MPYQINGKRDYKREDRLYNSRPEVIKKRDERNKARKLMEEQGKVHKGDGLQVDHKTPLSRGGKTVPSNLRVVPAAENESFRRNADGTLKSQVSKKERATKRPTKRAS